MCNFRGTGSAKDTVPFRLFMYLGVYMSRNNRKNRIILMLICLMIFTLTACGPGKQVIKEDDMTITLTKDFQKGHKDNVTWYYTSSDAIAIGIKVLKTDLEKEGLETNSSSDYAEAYIKANEVPGSPQVKSEDNYVYFEYNDKVSGSDYSYLTCIYDDRDSYWMVSFACYKDAYVESSKDFFKWADSVEFGND